MRSLKMASNELGHVIYPQGTTRSRKEVVGLATAAQWCRYCLVDGFVLIP